MRPHGLLLATALFVATFGMSPTASVQRLSIGVVAGGSLTDSFPSETVPAFFPIENGPIGIRYFSSSKDYIVGPMVELRLFSDWSVEVDGLYRKLHFTWAGLEADGSLNSISPSPVITWEFPVAGEVPVPLVEDAAVRRIGPILSYCGKPQWYAPFARRSHGRSRPGVPRAQAELRSGTALRALGGGRRYCGRSEIWPESS